MEPYTINECELVLEVAPDGVRFFGLALFGCHANVIPEFLIICLG